MLLLSIPTIAQSSLCVKFKRGSCGSFFASKSNCRLTVLQFFHVLNSIESLWHCPPTWSPQISTCSQKLCSAGLQTSGAHGQSQVSFLSLSGHTWLLLGGHTRKLGPDEANAAAEAEQRERNPVLLAFPWDAAGSMNAVTSWFADGC